MTYSLFLNEPVKGYFGAFPSQEEIHELYTLGVRLYINLTFNDEAGIGTYKVPSNCTYIHYPIVDRNAPSEWHSYAKFILQVCTLISKGISLYVHCRAGHGRSSTVCTSLLCQLNPDLHPETAIATISQAHASREGLGKKWRRMTNPMYRVQQIFIYKFFSTIYFCKAYHSGAHVGFSSFSLHPVQINGVEFPTVEAAYQYYLDPDDPIFLKKLLDTKKFAFIKLVGDDHWFNDDDPTTIDPFEVMYKVCKLKYQQNTELQTYLKKTYLRRLFDGCKYSHAENLVGRVLMKIREELFLEEV